MINAAEPVDSAAISEFYDTFGPLGLPRGVVIPTYGLAEHTVFVCSGGRTLLHLDKASLENGQVVVYREELLGGTSAAQPGAVTPTAAPSSDGEKSDGNTPAPTGVLSLISSLICQAPSCGGVDDEMEVGSSGTKGGGPGTHFHDPSAIQMMVGCGFPGRAEGVELKIVDAETSVDLGDGRV